MISGDELLKQSFFSELPFHPVPRTQHPVWAGSERTKQEILRIVNEVKHDNVELSHLVLVYGEYGSGKTHALRYLEHSLNAQAAVISAYLEKPKLAQKATFCSIAKEVIKQIGERPLRKAVDPIVRYIDQEANHQAQQELSSAESSDGDLSQKLQKLVADHKRDLQEELCPNFPELLAVFKGLTEEDSAAWQFLTGRPSAASLAKYGLTSPINDDHDALRALAGIYKVLTTDYPAIPDTPAFDAAYLFVDELEQLLDMKSEEVISLRTGFRDLFNACTEHFCLMIAATAENASLFHALLDEALMVRITAEYIHITSHDDVDDGVGFIRELMSNFRSSPPPTELHPFTQDGLEAIVDRTGLPKTARKLITNCRRAWEQSSAVIQAGGTIGKDEVDNLVGLI